MHAFATDPARVVFILVFLCIVVGGSLALYAWRESAVSTTGRFDWFSRETALLLNNVVFLTAAVAVFVGTLYPLVVDALGFGKISVGRPYFDTMFSFIGIPLMLLLGIGPAIRRKGDQYSRIKNPMQIMLITSRTIGITLPFVIDGVFNFMTGLGLGVALWVAMTTVYNFYSRLRQSSSMPRAYAGMLMAHLGVSVFVAGVTMTTTYGIEKDIRMEPGNTYSLSGYDFRFNGVRKIQVENYTADEGMIDVLSNGEVIGELNPQKRFYSGKSNSMTEASIDIGFMRDLYAAMGESLDDGAWSFRLYYKPMIRWIWLGCILMTLGGLLAVSDRRYRGVKVANKKSRLVTENVGA